MQKSEPLAEASFSRSQLNDSNHYSQMVSIERCKPSQRLNMIPSVQPEVEEDSPASGQGQDMFFSVAKNSKYSRTLGGKDAQQGGSFRNFKPIQRKSVRTSMGNLFQNRGNSTINCATKFLKGANLLTLKMLNVSQIQTLHSLQDFNGQRLWYFRLPLFEITSIFTLINDMIQLIVTILVFFLYPFQISFQQSGTYEQQVDSLILFILVTDILIHINRSIIRRGIIINSRVEIFNIYLKKQFSKDFIALISIVLKDFQEGEMFKLIFIITYLVSRLPRVFQILDIINNYLNVNSHLRDLIQLFYMIVSLIYVVHIVACIWHGVGNFEGFNMSWIKFYGFQDTPQVYKYQVSFYWAAMTMTTVGYGDITPKNQLEYLCANLTMLVACVVFGYTVNRIGILLSNIQMRKAEYKKNIALLNIYMRANKVNYGLQSRIRSYLDYQWQIEDDQHQKDVQIMIDKLSAQLKAELFQQVRGEAIQKCKVFDRFTPETKKKLCSSVENVSIAPNELIFDPDVNDGNSLYIILSGEIKVQLASQQPQCKHLKFKQGETVGIISFFTDQPRTLRAVSSDYLSLLRITRENFMNIINDSNRDKELFFYLKDSLLYGNQYQKLQVDCLFCQSDTHLISKCPLLHVNIDREKVLKQYLYPSVQERSKTILSSKLRQNRHKFPTFLRFQLTALTVQDYQNQQDQDLVVSQTQAYIEQVNQRSLEGRETYYELNNKRTDSEKHNSQLQIDRNKQILKDSFSHLSRIEVGDSVDVSPVPIQEASDEDSNGYGEDSGKLNSLPNFSPIRNSSKGTSIRQITTHIKTTKFNQLQPRKSFKLGSSFIGTMVEFSCLNDLDKMYQYKNYFPQYNFTTVISRLGQKVSKRPKRLSLYTFNFLDAIRAMRIRNRFQKEKMAELSS